LKDELYRYFLVGGIATAIGLMLNQLLLCLLIGAIAIIFWQYHRFKLLYDWLRRPSQNPMPYTAGVISDISSVFDRLMKSNRQRKKRLQQYMSQFRRGASALPDGLVILDDQTRIEWMNDTAKRYLDIDWPRDIQRPINNLIRHPNFTRLLNDAYSSDSELSPEQSTTEFPAPIDQRLVLSVSIVPYADDLYLLIARDVTRLIDTYTIRKDFVANVSHELKTPLTVFKGYVELLEGNKSLNDKAVKAVSEMREHSNRMHAIIEDLLYLSRLEHDTTPSNLEKVSVANLVTEIHDVARSVSGEDGHLFKFDINSSLLIEGSSSELQSAFTNLVVNAVKYTPAGGLIKIHWYKNAAGGHFEVIDNGTGIAERHLSRLTERFYRADADRSRNRGGTGLGLAIVKHVLQRHQAKLTIESELQVGSTFRCTFPASRLIELDLADTSKQA
jgi:two-component system, OmpR family, phosphate regulon sensor histidine kinase PhoR